MTWNTTSTTPLGTKPCGPYRATPAVSTSLRPPAITLRRRVDRTRRAVGAERQQVRRAWGLPEIEVVAEVVRARVPLRELRERPVVLDEPQDRGEVAQMIVDEALPGIRRDQQERNAEPEAEPVHLRRRNVIVEPAVVVPRDEDGGALPHRGVHDRVDHLRRPVLAVAEAVFGVFGNLVARRDPGDRSEAPVLDVADEVVDREDVLLPAVRIVPVAIDSRIRRPQIAVLERRRRVERPRDVLAGQEIPFGEEIEARPHVARSARGVLHLNVGAG